MFNFWDELDLFPDQDEQGTNCGDIAEADPFSDDSENSLWETVQAGESQFQSVDLDGDGIADAAFSLECKDYDGDGIFNEVTEHVSLDLNGDGIEDAFSYVVKTDRDNNGTVDTVEYHIEQDEDCSGTADYVSVGYYSDKNLDGFMDNAYNRTSQDLDFNNTWETVTESNAQDYDDNGIVDFASFTMDGPNGTNTKEELLDQDHDGTLETYKFSGNLDLDENGAADYSYTGYGLDLDGDGLAENVDQTEHFDIDSDGIHDAYVIHTSQDLDGDGMPDYIEEKVGFDSDLNITWGYRDTEPQMPSTAIPVDDLMNTVFSAPVAPQEITPFSDTQDAEDHDFEYEYIPENDSQEETDHEDEYPPENDSQEEADYEDEYSLENDTWEEDDFEDAVFLENPDGKDDEPYYHLEELDFEGNAPGTLYDHYDPNLADPAMVIGDPEESIENWHAQETNSSCCIAAQEFILDQLLNKNFSEFELRNVAEEQGIYTEGYGTPMNLVGDLMEYFGINVRKSYGNTAEKLEKSLVEGNEIIVSVDAEELWNGEEDEGFWPGRDANHGIQVVGIDKTDPDMPMVIINDSGVSNGAGAMIPLDLFMDAWEDSDCFMVEASV